jgi:hypothetical protein
MDRERLEELEEEEAQGVETWSTPGAARLRRLEAEAAEGIERFSDPYADLLAEQEREEAEGTFWIPEHIGDLHPLAGWVKAALAAHLTEEASEEKLFEQILETAPRLRPRVEELRRDHQSLADELENLTTRGREDIATLRRKVLAAALVLAAHRRNGADLLYDAYNVDIASL